MPRIITYLAVRTDGATVSFSHLAGDVWSVEQIAGQLLVQLGQAERTGVDAGAAGLQQLADLGYTIVSVKAHEAGGGTRGPAPPPHSA